MSLGAVEGSSETQEGKRRSALRFEVDLGDDPCSQVLTRVSVLLLYGMHEAERMLRCSCFCNSLKSRVEPLRRAEALRAASKGEAARM